MLVLFLEMLCNLTATSEIICDAKTNCALGTTGQQFNVTYNTTVIEDEEEVIVPHNQTWYYCIEKEIKSSIWYTDRYNKQIWIMNIISIIFTLLGATCAIIYFFGRTCYEAVCKEPINHIGYE